MSEILNLADISGNALKIVLCRMLHGDISLRKIAKLTGLSLESVRQTVLKISTSDAQTVLKISTSDAQTVLKISTSDEADCTKKQYNEEQTVLKNSTKQVQTAENQNCSPLIFTNTNTVVSNTVVSNSIVSSTIVSEEQNFSAESKPKKERVRKADVIPLGADTTLVATLPTRTGQSVEVLQWKVNQFAEAYPLVNVKAELKKMVVWCESNPHKRKTANGMMSFVNRWLASAQQNAEQQQQNKRGHNGTSTRERITSGDSLERLQRQYADFEKSLPTGNERNNIFDITTWRKSGSN